MSGTLAATAAISLSTGGASAEAATLFDAQLVSDVNTNRVGSEPNRFVNIGGTIYFTADDPVSGRELWRTDGTAVGTTLVADIRPGPGSSYPSTLTNVGGTLFFTAVDASTAVSCGSRTAPPPAPSW